MAAPIKMDELLVSWLGSDEVYDNVMTLIEKYRVQRSSQNTTTGMTPPGSPKQSEEQDGKSMTDNNNDPSSSSSAGIDGTMTDEEGRIISKAGNSNKSSGGGGGTSGDGGNGGQSSSSTTSNSPAAVIPPFYPLKTSTGTTIQRRRRLPRQSESWEPLPEGATTTGGDSSTTSTSLSGKTTSTSMTAGGSAFGSNPLNPSLQNTTEDPSSSGVGVGDVESTDEIEQLRQQQQEQEVIKICVRDQLMNLLREIQLLPPLPPGSSSSSTSSSDRPTATSSPSINIPPEAFLRICKEIFQFPTFFHGPLYQRILDLYSNHRTEDQKARAAPQPPTPSTSIHHNNMLTMEMIEWYWKVEMEPYDPSERFFRVIKQPTNDCILRDDFLPFIKALLNDHPGLEFLSNHAEFQEKYAVTVITRIFYSVNKCHSGRITSRQVRRSDLLEAFNLVDDEEDINKVTRYFSYEHFYVLYCRFWELDHDRDYRITREDLLKYGDHSLSHMIVDRIFDAAPRPFEEEKVDREFLSYEDFIYFMLSEEDKSNDVSVRYWFSCVDVDGDSKLNNMEMRSFYAVQLHRMQCMGHEIVPFEDMLCQMMDMIKPKNSDHLIVEDFLQPECSQVSGALFDALFNLNKYLMFEQRDPFVERQKREDEFDTDWDRFACIDYNRLAMEEEAREEEAMEIDWVTVDEDEEGSEEEFTGPINAEAPF